LWQSVWQRIEARIALREFQRWARHERSGIEASALQRVQRFQRARIHVRFFVLTSRRAIVTAVTRTPFDRFGKQLVRDAVEGICSVEANAEVPADARHIDLWVTPREAGASPPDHLGLLGRIISGSVTLEFFHNGSAADLDAVVDFYNQRFNIGFSRQEHADLVAFLAAL